ncbi:MAG: S8 family serine peptidase [Planctomycetes bacterium]|nr:S8 family serine peptidase [Planctomycetota bacterium]
MSASNCLWVKNFVPELVVPLDGPFVRCARGTPRTFSFCNIQWLWLFLSLLATSATNLLAEGGFQPQELVIQFKDDCPEERKPVVFAQLGVQVSANLGNGLYLVRPEGVRAAAEVLRAGEALAELEFVEADQPLQAAPVSARPAGPPTHSWWHLNTGAGGGLADADMDSTDAWNLRADASEVTVAVLDTGMDLAHEDLQANLWTNRGEIPDNGIDDDRNGYIDDVHGYDFVNGDAEASDDAGHGTWSAGLIGAVGHNRIGIDGVCWKVRLLPVKMLGAEGAGTLSDALRAIDYAASQGASILYAGWSLPSSKGLVRLVSRTLRDRVLLVAPAGDRRQDLEARPEGAFGPAENAVIVAASDRDDRLGGASNFGAASVALAAPGAEVVTTGPGSAYVQATGSALAAAQAAGAAALLQAAGVQSPAELRRRLMDSADRPEGLRGRTASGRLNLFYALLDSAPEEETRQEEASHRLGGHEVMPGELLVKFRAGIRPDRQAEVLRDLGFIPIASIGRGRVARVRLPEGLSLREALRRCRRVPDLEFQEPNYRVRALTTVPDDAQFAEQYSHQNSGDSGGLEDADIDSTEAWDLQHDASSVIVAIIDTGVDGQHEDLSANLWTNSGEIAGNAVDDDGNGLVDDVHGYDFMNGDGDPSDEVGHGTHVAGIIGAAGNNGIGVAGVCWSVQLMAMKFLGEDGGSTTDAVLCIDYAVSHGAKVLNNSWGGGGFSQTLYDAIQAAHEQGVLFVAAAGNDAEDNDAGGHYPSGYDLPNVIAVAASDNRDSLAWFSNFGESTVHLAAPGYAILSTVPGNAYEKQTGTSMACPHVTGACALLQAYNGGLGHLGIKQRILDTVDDKADLFFRTASGGRLNLYKALTDTRPGPAAFIALQGGPRVSENGGQATIKAGISQPLAVPETVRLTLGGTAVRDEDFTISSLVLTIPAGSTRASASFTALDDGVDESNETFILTLAATSSAAVTEDQSALGIIEDDDDTPLVYFETSTPTMGRAMAAGNDHTLSLMEDGISRAWGANAAGQLGVGDTTDRHVPTTISGLPAMKKFVAGPQQSLALAEDTTLWLWGGYSLSSPGHAVGISSIQDLIMGGYHALLVFSDGSVHSWGWNIVGQLGLGDTENRGYPTPIPGLYNARQIVAGYAHTMALMSDGTVQAWGWNGYGQLGLGDTVHRYSPTPVPGLTGVQQLAAGIWHSMALLNDGTVRVWGSGWAGQLGLGNDEDYDVPQPVPGLTGVRQIVAGGAISFAILENGNVMAWGLNGVNQLGIGDRAWHNSPASVPSLARIRQIIVGWDHCLAQTQEGTLLTWGYNRAGQLGLGFASTTVPVPVLLASQSSETSGFPELSASFDYTVLLSEPSNQAVTVDYAVTGGEAAAGADFTLDPGTLTFEPGETRKTIRLTVHDDALDEPDESVVIELLRPGHASLGYRKSHLHTITDNDDPPTLAFQSGFSSASESDASPSIQVTLSRASGRTITVDYRVMGGSASGQGVDYTLADGTLTFQPGETARSLPIEVVQDVLDEADETIAVNLSNPSYADMGGISSHTFTILDDDPTPTVSFRTSASSAQEHLSPAEMEVFLSAPSGRKVLVDYTVGGGSAVSASDFIFYGGTLTFLAGETSKTLSAVIVDDNLDEPDETLKVTLSNPSNASLGSKTVHTYTIEDDEFQTIEFVDESSSGIESAADVTVAVSLVSTLKTVTVSYSVTGGTAAAGGVDFTLASGSLTFNPGETRKNISLRVSEDDLDEDDETIVIGLSSPVKAKLGNRSAHTYTIRDNDEMPSVAFQDAASGDSEGAGPADLDVALSAASGRVVTVQYAAGGGSASGGGLDYTLASGVLTFAAGETRKALRASITADAVDEPDETFRVTLSSPANASLGAPSVHTRTIVDDDFQTVAFAAESSSGSESESPGRLAVTLSAASAKTATVNYAATGGSASGGGLDYTLASGLLTFLPGETRHEISLTVHEDGLDEDNETVLVSLSSPAGAQLGTPSTHTYTIADNDVTPALAFAVSASRADEDAGSVDLAVTLAPASGKAATVDYAVTGGSASGSGVDYTLAAGSLTFQPGETQRTLQVALADDALDEDDETVVIGLSHPSGALLGSVDTHTLTLADNEFQTLAFETESAGGAEADATAGLAVTLSAASAKRVTVHYAAAGGSASGSGVDYTLAAGSLTFEPGETRQVIHLEIHDDDLDEEDETVVVSLSNASRASLGEPSAHTWTVRDEDAAPSVAFLSAASETGEDAGIADMEVALSAASGRTIRVHYAVSGGSASGGGADYALEAGNLEFAPGETRKSVRVDITDDEEDEPDETLEVALSDPENAVLGGVAAHTASLLDNDYQAVGFELEASDAGEADGVLEVAVVLDAASFKTVSVDYAASGGTASGSGVDYTLAAGTLTFEPGETRRVIHLALRQDDLDEEDETVIVSLSNPVKAGLGERSVHTVSIRDEDASPTVSFVSAASDAAEDAGHTGLEAVLSAASGRLVRVRYDAAGGSATGGGTDYGLGAGTLEFEPGETRKPIRVDITDDVEDEEDETLEVGLSDPENADLGGVIGHVLTIVDNDYQTVAFEAEASDAGEGGGTVDLAVVLSAASAKSVSVDYAVTGGTASGSGVDFTLAAGTLTFEPGETRQVIAVDIVSDSLDEADETVVVELSNRVRVKAGAIEAHTLTVRDDDPQPSVAFAASHSSADEGSGAVEFEVALSAASGRRIQVEYAAAGGSATDGGVDYALPAGTLVFEPGETRQVLRAEVLEDAEDETDETAEVRLSAPVNAGLGGVSLHTHTIIDDDFQTLAFELDASAGDESEGAAELAVSLSNASAKTVSVDYAVTGGTASGSGVDFTLAAGTLTFEPGENRKEIVLEVADDALDEDDETVEIRLSSLTNALAGAQTLHTRTVRDDDPETSAAFETASSSVSEDAGAVEVAVVLAAASGKRVRVHFAASGGSASGGGADYTLASGELLFEPGETRKSIEVAVVDDALDEEDETVVLALSGPSNSSLGTPDTLELTLADNDFQSIAFDEEASEGPESESVVDLGVSLGGVSAKRVTVSYAATGGTASGSGVDYTLAAGSLTFEPGEIRKTLHLQIVGDALDEEDESVVIGLSSPVRAVLGDVTAHTRTIRDDDDAPTVSFEADGSSDSESGGTAEMAVSLSSASGKRIRVDYAVTGGTAAGGAEDYTLAAGSLTFEPGETRGVVRAEVLDDALDELDEALEVELSNPTNAALGTRTVHVHTITDNDFRAVAFALDSSRAVEANGPVTILVVLESASVKTARVDYRVTDGTAEGGGVDYALSAGTLTFEPGETEKLIAFTVILDDVVEDDETIRLALSNPSAAVLGSRRTHTYTIIEKGPPPVVRFAEAESRAGEDSGMVEFELTMSRVRDKDVTVDYEVRGGTAASDGNEADFTLASGRVTFAPGETSARIQAAIAGDGRDEADETFEVVLLRPHNADLVDPVAHTHTILDDDYQTVSFDAGSSEGPESEGGASIAVTLSGASAKRVTVEVAATGGSASGSGVDYTLAAGALTFEPGETRHTITLQVAGDELDEEDETVVLGLSQVAQALAGAHMQHTRTIRDDDASPSVSFLAAASMSPEDAGIAGLEVAISAPSGRPVRVHYAVTGGSASGGGTDYTLEAGILEFAPGETRQPVRVHITDDGKDELDEALHITLSDPQNASLGGVATHTLTLLDNDFQTVAFEAEASAAGEGDGTADVAVVLSAASAKTVSVDYAVSGGTASGGGVDFILAEGTLTLAPGETRQTIALQVADDALDEDDETVVVSLSNPVKAVLGVRSAHTVSIRDDDASPSVSLLSAASSAAEDAGDSDLEVALSAPSGRPVRVHYAVAGGSASGGGTDYHLEAGILEFGPGETRQSIRVSITDDGEDEPDETLEVALSGPQNADMGGVIGHTLTLLDNDYQTLTFEQELSAGNEGDGTADIAVVLSAASAKTVSVDYAVSGGTAAGGGVDFVLSAGKLTFEAGETRRTITLHLADDGLDEDDETVMIGLSGLTQALEGAHTFHTHTIRDNDAEPEVGFASAASAASEAAGAVEFHVMLSAASGRTTSVNYAVRGGNATGGGRDFTLTAGTLTFEPGETSRPVRCVVVNDAEDEVDETIEVELSGPVHATLGTDSVHVHTILDDDFQSVTFAVSSSGGAESAGEAVLEVLLSAASPKRASIDYGVSGGTASGSGIDYSLAAGTLVFEPEETRKEVRVNLVDDALDEEDETVEVALSRPVNTVFGARLAASYTIRDDDAAPSVAFESAADAAAENAGSAEVAVVLSSPSGRTIRVDFAAAGGSALGEGEDYSLAAGTLVFQPGQTRKWIEVDLVDDPLDEGDETVEIALSHPQNAAAGSPERFLLTLADNDFQAVAFSQEASSWSEADGSAGLAVSLTAPSAKVVSVSYAVTGGSASGQGVDYTLAEGTLIFQPGETLKGISVSIVNDALDEEDETLEVTLSGPVRAVLGGRSRHVATLRDNDPAPSVLFAANASSAGENTGPVEMDVLLSAPSAKTVTVLYFVNGGTATGNAVDYTLVGGALTFAPGETRKTIRAEILDDQLDEADETFQVGLFQPLNAALSSHGVHIHTIQDDDFQTVSFASASSAGTEDASTAALAVALSAASAKTVTVSYAVTGGFASGFGVDYALAPGTLTFQPGETRKEITLQIAEDALDEEDEVVVVNLSGPSRASLGATPTHFYTILDNDEPPSIHFATEASILPEAAGPLEIEVVLSSASGRPVSAGLLASEAGTATPDTDFALPLERIDFQPGETRKRIFVDVLDDHLDEPNETVEIRLADPAHVTFGDPAAHRVTLVDDDAPDLAVLSIVATPPAVLAGETTIVTITVRNAGNAVANPCDVTMKFDAASVSFRFGALAAGQTNQFSYTLTHLPATPDPHVVEAFLDSGGAIQESDENNNRYTLPIDVLAGPDLVIETLEAEPEPVGLHSPATVRFTVKNQGDAPAGSSLAGLYLDGRPLGSFPVEALGPGETSSVLSHEIADLPLRPNPHALLARADESDAVLESLESNNERVLPLGTALARMSSPATGSELGATGVTFEWTPGVGVSEYSLEVSSRIHGSELYSASGLTGRSAVVSGLPADGRTLYVRLGSRIGGEWHVADYTYLAASMPFAPARLINPAAGTALPGPTVTFRWSAGNRATAYYLNVGSGLNGVDYFNRNLGIEQSATVSGLPADGRTVYVRLWSRSDVLWSAVDYTFASARITLARAEITSPQPGTALPGPTVTFQWTEGSQASEYALSVGRTPAGIDLFNSTSLGGVRSATVSGLPADGSPVYVRLKSHLAGEWAWADYVYAAQASPFARAELTRPQPGNGLSSTEVTFEWSAGTGVEAYYLNVGNTLNGIDYFNRNMGGVRSATVSGLPTDGRMLYARLWSKHGTAWDYADYTFGATRTIQALAELIVPTPGSTLTSGTVAFEWTPGSEVSEYSLKVGRTPGGGEFFNASTGTGRSAAISNLPQDGSVVTVQLGSRIGGAWHAASTTLLAANVAFVPAELTSPAPGTSLPGDTATFEWSPGSRVNAYYLNVGSTLNGVEFLNRNLGTARSATVTGLPADGRTIHARLWSQHDGVWSAADYAFSAARASFTRAEITAPAPGSALNSPTVTFEWSAGNGVSAYYLNVGSTLNGVEFFNQNLGTARSATVTGLPADGRTVYVRLWSKHNGVWSSADCLYTSGTAPFQGAQITSPAPGSALNSPTVAFEWSAGSGVSAYYLNAGSTLNGVDFFNQNLGTARSATVTGLPADGRTVYVRLWSKHNGVWSSADYAFAAARASFSRAEITAPALGSALNSSSVTFQWSAGSGVSAYRLAVGNSFQTTEFYNADAGLNRSAAVTGLPSDGRALCVRLWSLRGSDWTPSDSMVTAARVPLVRPEMVWPAPGSALDAASVTFEWSAGNGVEASAFRIGSTPGGTDYFEREMALGRSATVSGLPQDGRTLYVRLSYLKDGVWHHTDYAYNTGEGFF